MPRIARVFAVGLPHHVTQRGNNRQRIFDSDEDRLVYLKLLREYAERRRVVLRTTVGEEAQAERIREATRTGRPMGEPIFVHDLERRLLRRLTPGKVGRPRRLVSEAVEDMFQAEEIGL